MAINSVKYTGKSTRIKMTRLIESLKNKRSIDDKKTYKHSILFETFIDGVLKESSKSYNFTGHDSMDSFKKSVINTYRISDIFNVIDNDNIIITSKKDNITLKATVTLIGIIWNR